MAKSSKDYQGRAELWNRWVTADFADITAAQKWAIDYLCRGALTAEILESGEIIETLHPDDDADSADQYDESDIAELLTLE